MKTKRGEPEMDKNLLKRITIDPGVLCGKPVIKGTRISVELILEKLVQGYSYQKITKEYDIQEEDMSFLRCSGS